MENKNKELFYNLGKIKYSEEDFKNLINDSNIPKEHYNLLFEENPKENNIDYQKEIKDIKNSYYISNYNNNYYGNNYNNYNNYKKNYNKNNPYKNNNYNNYYKKSNQKNLNNNEFHRSSKINQIEDIENFTILNNKKEDDFQPFEITNINFIIKNTIIKDKKNYLMQIDSIFKINENLNFSKDLKFWYLLNEKENYSYGPFSSNEIVIMFLTKKIDDNILIRPNEMFKNKYSENDFVYLKNFEDVNYFCNNYEINRNISCLNNNYDNYLKNENLRKIKEKEKKQKEKEELLKKEKEKKITENKKEKEKEKEKEKINEDFQKNEEEKKIENKEIETEKNIISNIKQEENNNINTKTTSNNNEHIIIKNKKRKKGKAINLDIKTGFYTISNQEKNFSQIYMSGSNEPLNNIPNNP